MVRDYLFSNYAQFRASELTFRDLKEHVAEKFSMTYEELKEDEYSVAIEDETDEVTNACNGGSIPQKECERREYWPTKFTALFGDD